MTMTIEAVSGYRCDDCEQFIDDPGGPVYECSRCGQNQVDERRCQSCNIFMAKVADQSCPHCEALIEELVEIEGFETDGQFFETEAEAQAYIDDTPAREERQRKAAEQSKRIIDEHLQQRKERAEALKPRMLAALDRLSADKAPELRRSIELSVRNLDHNDPTIYTPYIYFPEAARLLVPDMEGLEELLAIASDYVGTSREERDAADGKVLAAFLPKITMPYLLERIEMGFSYGTGYGVTMEEALDFVESLP